jgi:magnesium-transporting ATPase (P-type)
MERLPQGRLSGESRVCVPPWHAMPVDDVLRRCDVDPAEGLSMAQAQTRVVQHGRNVLPRAAPQPAWLRWLAQFHNPLIYVLLIACGATWALGDWVDAGVILGVVLINAGVGFLQEGRAQRALDAVRDMLAHRATVWREAARHEVDAQALVPGDIVLLGPGDRVPADLRLLKVRGLQVVESALTGESLPVGKQRDPVPASAVLAERSSLAYCGTLVASGQATGVVVATGPGTEVGRIGQMVRDTRGLSTPLTRRLDALARQITLLIVLLSALAFAVGAWTRVLPWMDLFLAVVGLAVAAIPEGLPAVVTIVLVAGTRQLARRQAVVRRLPAVETLGAVSVICTDKTGTLTLNEMTAVRVALPGRVLQVSGRGHTPEGGFTHDGRAVNPDDDAELLDLLRCATLCNDARLVRAADQSWHIVGDPTEAALVVLARKAGLVDEAVRREWPRVDEIPFTSDARTMLTLHHDHAGHATILLKGAPEQVLALCASQSGGQPLDGAYWRRQELAAAEQGERMLAFARCVPPATQAQLSMADMGRHFDMLGLVGSMDPPRAEAGHAIATCRAAGIQVKMVTGDHAVTAAAIGRALGLRHEAPLSGELIDALDDQALRERMAATDIVARASPAHKMRLVRLLQADGHLVAMTGDGVNDAPSLKAADIGVAMGGKGTEAAREAAAIVLTDDHFATITRAVREGRIVFDNIQKSLLFMVPTNAGEAFVMLLSILLGLSLPVSASQILWVNTVTAVTLALALAFEPGEPHVMAQPPRQRDQALLSPLLLARIGFVGGLMVLSTFAVFEQALARGLSIESARTAAVNMLVAGEAVYLFNSRHLMAPCWGRQAWQGNPVLFVVVGVLIGLQALFTYAPPMQRLFHNEGLDAWTWLSIGALAAAQFAAVELEKAWQRQRAQRRVAGLTRATSGN